MKTVLLAVVLVSGGLAATCFVSNDLMGGLEAGLSGGGNGKFAAYHEGSAFTDYLSGKSETGKSETGTSVVGSAVVGSAVVGSAVMGNGLTSDRNANPFAK